MSAHLAGLAPLVVPKIKIWTPGPVLDQGDKPQCVAYATEAWLNGDRVDTYNGPTPQQIYDAAQPLDGMTLPHDGTTVHAAMAVMQAEGRLGQAIWATPTRAGEKELWQWAGTQNGAIIGISFYESMESPDKHGFVKVKGEVLGGHGLYVYGIDQSTRVSFYYVQNSWGDQWGDHGRFKIRRSDMARLLAENGEACGAMEIALAA